MDGRIEMQWLNDEIGCPHKYPINEKMKLETK
jgi:hypothetical protein